VATSSASSFNQAPPPCLLVLESIGGGGTCLWPRRLSCFFLLLYSCGYCGLLGLGSCHAACLQSSASSASYRPTLTQPATFHVVSGCRPTARVSCVCACVFVCVRVCACVLRRAHLDSRPSCTPACLHTHLLSRSHPSLLVLLTPNSCHCQTHLLRWCTRRLRREQSTALLRREHSTSNTSKTSAQQSTSKIS
jgi:hypothetical protein